jgi:chemotaxis protein CheD
MTTSYNATFQREITTIHPGEFSAATEDVILSTLLGSCVAVVLFDPEAQCSGMNHFLLPARNGSDDLLDSRSGRYGMYAMELLINSLMKLGAHRKNFVAKVFGGASTLRESTGFRSNIPQHNIDFAMNYLKIEGIPVIGSDVGGVQARKIFLYTRTAQVKLKRIQGSTNLQVAKHEEKYLKTVRTKSSEGNGAVLF